MNAKLCGRGVFAAPVAVAGLFLSTMALGDTLLTFEEGVGNDQAVISTFYSGITFTADSSGSEWVFRDGTTGSYNMSSWPSGVILGGGGEYWIYGFGAATTALDDTGNNGRVVFDNANATYVELGYSFTSPTTCLTLTAYDINDNVLDSDCGDPNLRFVHSNPNGPGTLRVDAPPGELIAYVIVSDSGNFWVIDNLMTDATGITTGSQGCSLGFWKQPHHFGHWVDYDPDDLFCDVFDCSTMASMNAYGGKTLHDVLSQGGGQLRALGRQAVAALLNATSSVAYPYTEAEVIQMVNDAIASQNNGEIEAVKDELDEANNLGCPLTDAADLNGDAVVDVSDLLMLFENWGVCASSNCTGDISGSGSVDVSDLLILLSSWGSKPAIWTPHDIAPKR